MYLIIWWLDYKHLSMFRLKFTKYHLVWDYFEARPAANEPTDLVTSLLASWNLSLRHVFDFSRLLISMFVSLRLRPRIFLEFHNLCYFCHIKHQRTVCPSPLSVILEGGRFQIWSKCPALQKLYLADVKVSHFFGRSETRWFRALVTLVPGELNES